MASDTKVYIDGVEIPNVTTTTTSDGTFTDVDGTTITISDAVNFNWQTVYEPEFANRKDKPWVLINGESLGILYPTTTQDYVIEFIEPKMMGLYTINPINNTFIEVPKGSTLKAAKILYKP